MGPALEGLLDEVTRMPVPAAVFDWMRSDAEAMRTLSLVGEILIAGTHDSALGQIGSRLWSVAEGRLGGVLPPGMAWYAGVAGLGNAMLRVLGIHGPRPSREFRLLMTDAVDGERASTPGGETGGVELGRVELPRPPSPASGDDVSVALIEAARLLLRERGAERTTTRDIAAGAGVSTGALYRRYEGKSRLLADVLLHELQPERYEWTWELIRALAKDEPYVEAAEVLSDRILEMSGDLPSQAVLLQVGVAARNDESLRSQIRQRVDDAQAARLGIIETLVESGLMRPDLDCASLAWGFQAVPVGMRVLLCAGMPPDPPAVRAGMRALCVAGRPDGTLPES